MEHGTCLQHTHTRRRALVATRTTRPDHALGFKVFSSAFSKKTQCSYGINEISRAIGVKNWQRNYVSGFFINAISGRWHRLHLYGFEASSIAANCIQKTAGPRAKVAGHGI